MRRFSRFACIDWSGAVGEFPSGLALASIGHEGAPELIGPDKRWSRQAILEWLLECADAQEDILIGLDLSFGFPFLDHGSFFPEWDDSPADARALWALIDQICADDRHLAANSFLAHSEARTHRLPGTGGFPQPVALRQPVTVPVGVGPVHDESAVGWHIPVPGQIDRPG